MKNALFITFWALSILTSAAMGKETFYLASPSKKVVVNVNLNKGEMSYQMMYNHCPVILSSRLIFGVDDVKIGEQVVSCMAEKGKKNTDSYAVMGAHSQAKICYREMQFRVKDENGRAYSIQMRAYNQGIAFRYLTEIDQRAEVKDFTTFRLPAGSSCWMQGNITSYEGTYEPYEVGKLPKNFTAGPPVTIRFGKGIYSAITEGDLVNFGGMSLRVIADDEFQASLFDKTYLSGKVATPWRIVMVGDLNDLVNNDIITDVSEPLASVFHGQTDWIKPGNCVWSWLAGGGVTFDNMKHFTDMAAALHIPYNLVDEGWSHWEGGGQKAWDKLAELVKYADAKGVKTLVWKAYPDRAGIDGLQTKERLHAFLDHCKSIGVAGCKIDFFDGETQRVTQFFADALDDAAQLKLVIDFHGANKPTGLERTYPNELTREGILGLEYGHSVPEQDVLLPFTRFLAGHGDYTPMTFDPNRMNGTTNTYQMAVTELFTSPLRCYGGNPDDYLKHPARDLFLSIPVMWDETRVLAPSELGLCAVMARRSGKTWYIAAITKDSRTFSIPLNFLPNGHYRATGYSDEDGMTSAVYGKKDSLKVNLKSKDGFLLRLQPE